jgi:hypothetical protein
MKQGRGPAALDHEIVVLRSAWKYASKHPNTTGVVDAPSLTWVQRLRHSVDVEHCREKQPENANELHEIAAYFLNKPIKHAVVGWFVLFQAMIGARRAEILKLRIDAKNSSQPGFDDGEHLWLYRSKTHKGTADFAKIHADLRNLLNAHRQWITQAFPGSPFFSPSIQGGGDRALGATSVNAGFARLKADTRIDKTSHGLRSYFVNVLRSHGVSDAEIALRIGHKGAANLIVQVYGEVLPIKIGWTPDGPPAWDRWAGGRAIVRAEFG